jgi:hypothetical protein
VVPDFQLQATYFIADIENKRVQNSEQIMVWNKHLNMVCKSNLVVSVANLYILKKATYLKKLSNLCMLLKKKPRYVVNKIRKQLKEWHYKLL